MKSNDNIRICDFNRNWIFSKQDEKDKQIVNLPHDAMIIERRDAESPGGSGSGYFYGGVYVYEKSFDVPKGWNDKRITFEFEGVYKNSKVYINEKLADKCAYGYIPFFVEADEYLNYGEKNTIRVVADNSQMPNSRWYSGSGIYRPVWLHVKGKVHIKTEGVKITTLSYSPARILVETSHEGGDVEVEILYENEKVTSGKGEKVELDIPDAKLWNEYTPNLYKCRVKLIKDGIISDSVTETFGIRMVEVRAEGLYINGQETLLRGGCVHHDNGILGARSYVKSEERKVRIMKENGYNAIRSAHNPTSKAMLDACDKYGMYMMDETWDMWYSRKDKYDYSLDFSDNYKLDIKSMVDRDFNHPSVIMYSIGNEISEPKDQKGIDLTKEMVDLFHSLDRNRVVTCGVNLMIIYMASKGKGIYKEEGGLSKEPKKKKKKKATSSTLFNMMTSLVGTGMNKAANSKRADAVTTPCLDALDVAGYNYASGRYKKEGKKHPGRIVVGTETFPQDISKNWNMVKKYPYLVGDFMWTAWDYLGEAGIGAWTYEADSKGFKKPFPWILADVGAIDILGNAGAQAALAATVWGKRKTPYIGVRPVNRPKKKPFKSAWRGTNAIASWSWKNCDGNRATVEIYADAKLVELLHEGKSLGKKKVKANKAIFKTIYKPGILTAVSYDLNGNEISRSSLTSATGEIAIDVNPEDNNIKVGEIAYLNISLKGENGKIESNADTKLTVNVENGELLAFGSAQPCTKERYYTGNYTTYYGRAQAIVRANNPGRILVHVSGEKIETKTAYIQAE